MKDRNRSFLLRLAALLAGAVCLVSSALCEPLPLAEDLKETLILRYDEDAPDSPAFEYSYVFPRADESDPTAYLVNEYYDYQVRDTADFTFPILADYYRDTGMPASIRITYEVTCNNDEYFSVLLKHEESFDGMTTLIWEGHVFSRLHGVPGSTYTLPELLGFLSADENDSWLEERQTAKADALIRETVWRRIQENADGIPWYEDLTWEAFSSFFVPEEDFYLDETANPVFFLQPGAAAPESAGLLTFPLSIEEILDEM